ncbi:MAG: rhamnulokinase [Promethearchaeota archaeon]|nr:MAG: rhamnulokinase [Candidatus Lokiarchaeota archaeon]
MTTETFLAFDFGAQSARAVLGCLENKRLEISEEYRFRTGGIRVGDTLRWDILQFFDEIKIGCKHVAQKLDDKLVGIGIDSWGVDYVLLDHAGNLVSLPYHYRDNRTNKISQDVFKIVSKEKIYDITGIQFMQINTIFQLYSMVRDKNPDLLRAKTFLHIADFFHYLLTKKVACEYTLATTSQLYDLHEKRWSYELIDKLGLNSKIFPEIVPHSTIIGPLLPNLSEEVGVKDVSVIAPATHDTGAAIAAIPATHSDFIYISSGTWSLLGTELAEPLVSEESLKNNFTNEGGVFGTIRLLKNISGLWILSECKKIWDGSKASTFTELNREASEAKAFQSFIDPDASLFLNPKNMIAALQSYCKSTKQPIPRSRGEIVRCILESLAMKYKLACSLLKKMVNRTFKTIHIIGGGSQNRLLSQFTSNSTGLEVRTGPVEATAIGNILTQIASQRTPIKLIDLRKIVRNSFEINTLVPQDTSDWEDAYQRFVEILKQLS